MGYSLISTDCISFHIKKENIAPALVAFNKAYRDLVGHVEADGFQFSRLEDAMIELRWEPGFDPEGNIVSVCFTGEKLWEDHAFFQILAPYVDKDSEIRCIGEDGALWRWYFNGTECIEEPALVIYPTVCADTSEISTLFDQLDQFVMQQKERLFAKSKAGITGWNRQEDYEDFVIRLKDKVAMLPENPRVELEDKHLIDIANFSSIIWGLRKQFAGKTKDVVNES